MSMQKETFNRLLNNVNALADISVEELEAFAHRYAYFTLSHVLYAKKLHCDSDPGFENALALAAIHTYDRERLFQFIERTPLTAPAAETAIAGSGDTRAEQLPPEEKQETPIFETIPYEMELMGALSGMDEEVIAVRPEEMDSDTRTEMHTFSGWVTAITGTYNVRTVEPGERNRPIQIDVDGEGAENHIFNEADARQMAAKSIAMDNNIITETFALVLAIQGNTKKAIEVYEKLCLKYPEKKSYFAAKIEELRKS